MFYTCLSVHREGSACRGLSLEGLHSGGGGLPTWWSAWGSASGGFGVCIRGRGSASRGVESASGRRGFCIQGVGGSASRGEDSASGGRQTPGTRNVGGMHPTGMLSCLSYFVRIKRRNGKFSRSIFHDHNIY